MSTRFFSIVLGVALIFSACNKDAQEGAGVKKADNVSVGKVFDVDALQKQNADNPCIIDFGDIKGNGTITQDWGQAWFNGFDNFIKASQTYYVAGRESGIRFVKSGNETHLYFDSNTEENEIYKGILSVAYKKGNYFAYMQFNTECIAGNTYFFSGKAFSLLAWDWKCDDKEERCQDPTITVIIKDGETGKIIGGSEFPAGCVSFDDLKGAIEEDYVYELCKDYSFDIDGFEPVNEEYCGLKGHVDVILVSTPKSIEDDELLSKLKTVVDKFDDYVNTDCWTAPEGFNDAYKAATYYLDETVTKNACNEDAIRKAKWNLMKFKTGETGDFERAIKEIVPMGIYLKPVNNENGYVAIWKRTVYFCGEPLDEYCSEDEFEEVEPGNSWSITRTVNGVEYIISAPNRNGDLDNDDLPFVEPQWGITFANRGHGGVYSGANLLVVVKK